MPGETPTPEAAPEPEAVAPDPAGDAGQVDISQLPAAVQSYIKELREEARDRRKEHEPYKKVFEQYNAREQEFLLSMVDDLGRDQTKGAKAMIQFAQQLLGTDTPKEEETPVAEEVEEETPAAAPAGITKEDVAQLLKEQAEQQKLIDQVHAETKALGFEPGSNEAKKLWDMAITLQEADLSKVAPLVHQYFGTTPGGEETAEEEPAEEPESSFPKTAGKGGSGGVNEPAEPQAIPAIKSDDMRARVLARLSQQAGE